MRLYADECTHHNLAFGQPAVGKKVCRLRSSYQGADTCSKVAGCKLSSAILIDSPAAMHARRTTQYCPWTRPLSRQSPPLHRL